MLFDRQLLNSRRGLIWLALFSFCFAAGVAFAQDPVADGDVFERLVRPILLQHCAQCHAQESAEMELILTAEVGVLSGSETGPVVVPGNAGESLLVQVLSQDGQPHMPPDGQLAAKQIAAIASWVDALDPQLPVGRSGITAQDREHWAFQPLIRRPLPKITDRAFSDHQWPRTAIDHHIAAGLEAAGLAPAEPADKATLLRRLYYDLIGLPPEPEQVQAVERDPSPVAYERIVDRLLASPRYGERWGRHWLDLSRYADSSGFHNDLDRAGAWHFRDYVIASFNADKPYDQFIREQIAGDQLPDATLASWIATGFARTGPSNDDNMGKGIAREQYRLDELDGVVSTTSNVFLGLTLGCARCHDHKFDPISQRDYYRFLAYFDDTENRQLDVDTFQPGIPPNLSIGSVKNNSASAALVLTNQGAKPRTTRLLWRGDVRNPGPQVEPDTPEVFWPTMAEPAAVADGVKMPPDQQASAARRLELADWIADPANPLSWRVMANRIWMHHFGEGLVRTPSNFGRLGERPTHPELLDLLADQLRRDASVKSLHRTIVTSAVYRQSSTTHALALQLDPENRWYGRMPRRRLEAEPLRDAFLSVAGNLNSAMGGPGVKPRIRPDLLVASQRNKWPVVKTEGPEHWRRSVYVYVKRQLQLPLLELFDAPATTHSCARREQSLVPTQALVMMNDEFLHEQAARLAVRVQREAGEETAEQVRRALWIALSRPPGEQRVSQGVAFLASQAERLRAEGYCDRDANGAALTDLCHLLMNLSEFVYVD